MILVVKIQKLDLSVQNKWLILESKSEKMTKFSNVAMFHLRKMYVYFFFVMTCTSFLLLNALSFLKITNGNKEKEYGV